MLFATEHTGWAGELFGALIAFVTTGGLAALLRYVENSNLTRIAQQERDLKERAQREAAEHKKQTEEAEQERERLRQHTQGILDRYQQIITMQHENDEKMAAHLQEIQDRYTDKASECATYKALSESLAEQLKTERAKSRGQ